ncbi:methylmalonyl Co-A mutase-associated GTPase MeaB [Thermoflexibacter ruber]|uniref:Methylmalonyl-CoA mutase metallochaperone MeaB n=1 Tax=Thermoflexibacter ruber TaxID=1003 RepID=A0A1I2A4J1_9BACT|nr:methylmalonyl Co-A mutase-associated GTPase MeaB [Thermoflexibacter ruber]SFE38872.1 methylmalonyl-CoA mutase metallochaperone MeaB [Thermoflexibacter ruber]
MRKRLSIEEYIEGIKSQNRFVLSRAITLVESELASDNALASELIEALLPLTGNSIRIGITGVPGVGKSTFIEAFGNLVTSLGKKLAVLAIDPSSQRTGGSIMGDKTRMETLGRNPLAFIRPSPAGSSLGGVSRKTRESMLLCEAAGFEVILIETVGVGQSETAVSNMVDFFLLLMLAGAGDELQGIKKGIMEMADAVVITKADGDNAPKAHLAKAEYQSALHLFPPSETGWQAQVLTCSALENKGLQEIWELIMQYQCLLQSNHSFQQKRQAQNIAWMHEVIKQSLENQFYNHFLIKKLIKEKEDSIKEGKQHSVKAAIELLELYANR